jgi:hypothetical protein
MRAGPVGNLLFEPQSSVRIAVAPRLEFFGNVGKNTNGNERLVCCFFELLVKQESYSPVWPRWSRVGWVSNGPIERLEPTPESWLPLAKT